jgi:hypothetical protein
MFGNLGAGELLTILIILIWIWCLVDILKSNFDAGNKAIWILVISFVPFFGVLLYFFIGRKQKSKFNL